MMTQKNWTNISTKMINNFLKKRHSCFCWVSLTPGARPRAQGDLGQSAAQSFAVTGRSFQIASLAFSSRKSRSSNCLQPFQPTSKKIFSFDLICQRGALFWGQKGIFVLIFRAKSRFRRCRYEEMDLAMASAAGFAWGFIIMLCMDR